MYWGMDEEVIQVEGAGYTEGSVEAAGVEEMDVSVAVVAGAEEGIAMDEDIAYNIPVELEMGVAAEDAMGENGDGGGVASGDPI